MPRIRAVESAAVMRLTQRSAKHAVQRCAWHLGRSTPAFGFSVVLAVTGLARLSDAAPDVRADPACSTDGVDSHTPFVVPGALYLPKGTPPQGGWPLLAWAHGTVGTADRCAPSFAGRSVRDTSYLSARLARGYAIVATDFQGLGTSGPHPYGLTRPLAYDLLDSIRAVQNSRFTVSSRVVVFGQSQGAQAGFAAAGYARQYTPDLDIVGVVLSGTP